MGPRMGIGLDGLPSLGVNGLGVGSLQDLGFPFAGRPASADDFPDFHPFAQRFSGTGTRAGRSEGR